MDTSYFIYKTSGKERKTKKKKKKENYSTSTSCMDLDPGNLNLQGLADFGMLNTVKK